MSKHLSSVKICRTARSLLGGTNGRLIASNVLLERPCRYGDFMRNDDDHLWKIARRHPTLSRRTITSNVDRVPFTAREKTLACRPCHCPFDFQIVKLLRLYRSYRTFGLISISRNNIVPFNWLLLRRLRTRADRSFLVERRFYAAQSRHIWVVKNYVRRLDILQIRWGQVSVLDLWNIYSRLLFCF